MATYLLPKARNTLTGQTVKAQDLTGGRFELRQRALAEDFASQMAAKLSDRTGETWEPFVIEYTPTTRTSS